MVLRSKNLRIVTLVFALIASIVISLGVSSPVSAMKKKPPTPDPAPSGDFSFSLNMQPQYGWVGYMVRGGGAGPVYEMNSYGSCWYTTNFLGMVSLDGFEGDVTLDVLNMPTGVTEDLPATVFVPERSAAITYIYMHAASNAQLGITSVTLRGTSGSIVHTLELPFEIVDELPPLDPACSYS